jgi:hypothetical protein
VAAVACPGVQLLVEEAPVRESVAVASWSKIQKINSHHDLVFTTTYKKKTSTPFILLLIKAGMENLNNENASAYHFTSSWKL